MLRFRRQRDMDDHCIRLTQQLIQRDELHAFLRLRVARIREHARAESTEFLCRAAPDAPVTHDADRERAHAKQARGRGLPPPRFHFTIEMHEAARERQQHADGMIRHFFEAVVGNVRDPDAATGRLIHSDVVEADAEAPDDSQV